MTDGYEAIYRARIDSAGRSGAASPSSAPKPGEREAQPRPLKPVMSADLAGSGRAS
jgi:hypothetical protein